MSTITICTVSSVQKAAQELKLSDDVIKQLMDKIKEVSSDISVPGMLVRPYNRQDFGGIH